MGLGIYGICGDNQVSWHKAPDLVVSHNNGTPIYYNPDYGDPKDGTPNSRKPHLGSTFRGECGRTSCHPATVLGLRPGFSYFELWRKDCHMGELETVGYEYMPL